MTIPKKKGKRAFAHGFDAIGRTLSCMAGMSACPHQFHARYCYAAEADRRAQSPGSGDLAGLVCCTEPPNKERFF